MSTGSHRRSVRLIPFWKNERIPFTGITAAGALRAMLVAVVIFTSVSGFAIWKLIDLGSNNQKLIKQYKSIQDTNHASRLVFEAEIKAQQAYTQGQVRSLACSIVAFTAPSEVTPFITSLITTYRCPPYKAPTTSPAALRTDQNSPSGGSAPAGPGQSIVLIPSALTMATPLPSATPSARPSATSSSATSSSPPVIVPSTSSVCLLGLVCLK